MGLVFSSLQRTSPAGPSQRPPAKSCARPVRGQWALPGLMRFQPSYAQRAPTSAARWPLAIYRGPLLAVGFPQRHPTPATNPYAALATWPTIRPLHHGALKGPLASRSPSLFHAACAAPPACSPFLAGPTPWRSAVALARCKLEQPPVECPSCPGAPALPIPLVSCPYPGGGGAGPFCWGLRPQLALIPAGQAVSRGSNAGAGGGAARSARP